MEKDVQLGQVGKLALSFSGGKALLSLSGGYDPAGFALKVEASEDAAALVDLLFAAIEKASPAGVQPIEESVKGIVKAAVQAIA